jgi:hypothetical protein
MNSGEISDDGLKSFRRAGVIDHENFRARRRMLDYALQATV